MVRGDTLTHNAECLHCRDFLQIQKSQVRHEVVLCLPGLSGHVHPLVAGVDRHPPPYSIIG
jgi:hypothetical protein